MAASIFIKLDRNDEAQKKIDWASSCSAEARQVEAEEIFQT